MYFVGNTKDVDQADVSLEVKALLKVFSSR